MGALGLGFRARRIKGTRAFVLATKRCPHPHAAAISEELPQLLRKATRLHRGFVRLLQLLRYLAVAALSATTIQPAAATGSLFVIAVPTAAAETVAAAVAKEADFGSCAEVVSVARRLHLVDSKTNSHPEENFNAERV